ncbi:MAG: LysR family transcriptional regulator, partial [Burkholderiales bacterium]|nr:LysR family transcriptional regulator [Burkholderiales bacterium]
VDLDTVNLPFAPHPYVIVAAPGHPLAGQRRIARSRLLREPFIVRERGSDTSNSIEEGFGGDIAGVRVAMEIRSTETIKQAVMAGMGVSFLSGHTISQELRNGSLCVLDVQGFPLLLNWYLVHRRTKRLPPVAQAFKQFLLADGAALIEQMVPTPMPQTSTRRRPSTPRRAAR